MDTKDSLKSRMRENRTYGSVEGRRQQCRPSTQQMIKMPELNVATAPKNGTFQMRINPDIKEQVERIYANCGMTLTDAINTFLQQSINVGGLPFLVTQNSKEALRQQAIVMLMQELKKGEDSVKSEADWISEEDVAAEFGVDL